MENNKNKAHMAARVLLYGFVCLLANVILVITARTSPFRLET
ncbi:Hypothetical protein I595_3168 [Croceitalea dokdonensis DOKDO 023]|uniref:Uncharacterized protein n=1 Tax=Croceitalea dokdonensis DOKDO 023 TaxID=1300341 RepID=A0A0P7ARY4_9FLAO|nr:Hypothetical protein I595_3168 [Croceitalea dokdonensis DOKDO 023]